MPSVTRDQDMTAPYPPGWPGLPGSRARNPDLTRNLGKPELESVGAHLTVRAMVAYGSGPRAGIGLSRHEPARRNPCR